MGMSVAGGGGGGGRRRGHRRSSNSGLMSEINVTPMVDVMLVLLIIFMVAAPLMTVGVPVDLPQTAAKPMNTDQKPVIVSVTNEGAIYLGESPVQLADLPQALTAQGVDPEVTRVNVRGDLAANYGSVMQVMGALSGAGYSKIGLITEQAQPAAGQGQ
jgi:biopolymer transport protein TolR